ncbi:MAG: hypothetical protein HYX79_08380 [Chloroflexi bacterium]|nr:hypothetical protein [Chloroflexota bacterium]
MFYEHPAFERTVLPGAKLESALVSLNPAESKRLVAKAVAALPEIKAVLKEGTLVIAWGTTNAFVAEEVLGKTIAHKADFASGVISEGELNSTYPGIKINPFVLQNGKLIEMHQKEALRNARPGDVFIKGANAIDANGNIGTLVAAHAGGFMYDAWFAAAARGATFICPVGLEKLVPSVSDAAQKCGLFRYKYSMGLPCALITFANAKVVTEIQAIRALTGAGATHVASGGIAGSEGAVALALEGEADVLERAFELVKSVKGEPPVLAPRKYTNPRAESVGYDPLKLSEHVR